MNKKIISLLLVSSLLLASCWGNTVVIKEDPVAKKSVTTTMVKKDYFSEQLKLVWKVSSIMETPISPLSSWIIKSINIEVWQKVKAWQILAKIDLSSSAYATAYNNADTAYNNSLNAFSYTEESIKNDLLSAKVQLDNAKMAKDNTYSVTEKQLELAQTQLDNIKNTVRNTANTASTSQKNIEIQLKSANDKLDMDKKSFEANLSSSYSNLKNAITLAGTLIDSSLTYADTLLWVTDKNKSLNDTFENYLWAKNTDTKTSANKAFTSVNDLWNSFLNNQYWTDRDSFDKEASDIIAILWKTDGLYSDITAILNNSITSSTFTQDTLVALLAKVSSIQSWATWQWWIIWLKTQLDSIINGIVTLKTQYSIAVDADNNAINSAQANLDNIKAWNISQLDNVSWNETLTQTQYENTVASIKQSRDWVDNALKIAQANYDSVNAKLNTQKIQAKSSIDSAKWWKDLAGISLDNTSIIAPYDGVITARNIEVWSSTNPGSPAFVIWNNDNIKIKLDINSEDITNLSLGQIVNVKRRDNSYTGIISLVSPNSDPTTKMFKAEISFEKKPDSLNLWDFVDVYINKQKSKDKFILVPFSSIISLGQWEYNIFVVSSWAVASSRSVKIWSQNSNDVVITSWLKEWERVVTAWTLNLQDWDKIEESK